MVWHHGCVLNKVLILSDVCVVKNQVVSKSGHDAFVLRGTS